MSRTISLILTPQEFTLLKHAVDELVVDSDPGWGDSDDSSGRHEQAIRLAARLKAIEQMVVIPH